jgi:hypothetical protein
MLEPEPELEPADAQPEPEQFALPLRVASDPGAPREELMTV